MLKKILAVTLLAAMLAGFAGFSAAAEPAATEVPTQEQPAEAVQEEVKELTPADRAAAKGLPAPPDVDITSWEFKVANSYNNILLYAPPYADMEGQGIDQRAFDACSQLLADARAEGISIFFSATYRNFDFQYTYYYQKVRELGSAYEAAKVYHGPGNSDHQVGLSFDVTAERNMACNYSPFETPEVVETDAYKWVLEHGTDYGFILRFPEGKEEYYGTPCHNGHFRYVGVDAAKYITENNLCLEEFILLYDEDAIHVPGIN